MPLLTTEPSDKKADMLRISVLHSIVHTSTYYTHQQKKVCTRLWWPLKDLIFHVQCSIWYHFKACPIVFKMMGQTLFYSQYTINYRPFKFKFCHEKNSQKSQNRQISTFSAKPFLLLFFSLNA